MFVIGQNVYIIYKKSQFGSLPHQSLIAQQEHLSIKCRLTEMYRDKSSRTEKHYFCHFILGFHHIASKMVHSSLDKDLITTCFTEKV